MNFSHIVQDKNEFLISKLKCRECGSGFYRKKSKGYYYYICKSRYRKLGCDLGPIRKDILENMVLVDINETFKINKKTLNKNMINKKLNVYDYYYSLNIK